MLGVCEPEVNTLLGEQVAKPVPVGGRLDDRPLGCRATGECREVAGERLALGGQLDVADGAAVRIQVEITTVRLCRSMPECSMKPSWRWSRRMVRRPALSGNIKSLKLTNARTATVRSMDHARAFAAELRRHTSTDPT